jgi:hypothetical protein
MKKGMSSMGASCSGNFVLNISTVHGGNSLAALNSLGGRLDDRVLIAVFVNLVLTHGGVEYGLYHGVVQNRQSVVWNNKLSICLSLSFTFHFLSSLLASSSLNNLGCTDLGGDISADLLELHSLDWNLNILALIVNLGCALLEGDDLLHSGAVGGVVHQGSQGSYHGVEGVSFGFSLTLHNSSIGEGQSRDKTHKHLHPGDLNASVV